MTCRTACAMIAGGARFDNSRVSTAELARGERTGLAADERRK